MEAKIIIKKPCHENWTKMTPEEKGRHCAVCSKVVKDFTGMQTNEIVKELQQVKGDVCGRVEAKNLTPANKKQELDFWVRSFVFRKAIYPLMAFLGVSFVTKKATAQISHDYPVKGKIAVSDYHTQKKVINLVVKDEYGKPVPGGRFRINSGIAGKQKDKELDGSGKATIILDPAKITGDKISVEIFVSGYQSQEVDITLAKNVQTVEVKMTEAYMIMGDIYYVPEEIVPEKKARDIDSFFVDTVKTIEVEPLTPQLIETLPFLQPDLIPIEKNVTQNDVNGTTEPPSYEEIVAESLRSVFNVYPVPSNTVVNISSSTEDAYQLNVFDGEGKTRQTVINCMGTYTLDISNYLPGIYYLQLIVDGKAIETKKIIVTN